VRTEALLTAMDAPLGRAVGNANEVIESIETLKGRGPKDLEDLSVRLAVRMLVLAGRAADDRDGEQQVRHALTSGAGVERFRAIIEAQGGDPRVIDDYDRLPSAPISDVWRAPRRGIVARMDAELVGRAAVVLGAGRDRVDADVDPAAGIDIAAAPGDEVGAGAAVFTLRTSDRARLDAARRLLDDAVTIGGEAPAARPLVLEIIDGRTASV